MREHKRQALSAFARGWGGIEACACDIVEQVERRWVKEQCKSLCEGITGRIRTISCRQVPKMVWRAIMLS